MKNYSFLYEDSTQIDEFLKYNSIALKTTDEILIQVFTGINDPKYIKKLIEEIKSRVPKAKIIGATTCGEISNQGMILNSTVVSITLFETTKIITKLIEANEDSFTLGEKIVSELYKNCTEDPKVLISFTDGLNTNGEEYLNGINSFAPDLIVAGGMAADNSFFEKTYIFDEEKIIDNGAIVAALYNDNLNVYTNYNFNWKKLGKSHKIEKSNKNRVYKIDGQTAVDFYGEYLGEDVKKLLPAIGVEFPLVIKEDDEYIARAVLTKHNDGSLSFAGNVKEGSLVKFGYGDVSMILKESIEHTENIYKHPIESIFIYSCMARKALLKEDINLEILPLKELAPISGFFTYGEFSYSKNKHRLLNETMTILGLSEGSNINSLKDNSTFKHSLDEVKTMHNDLSYIRNKALSRLITQTTFDLEELNTKLQSRVEEEIQKSMEKDNIMFVHTRHAQLGEMIGMISHQWRQPLSAISTAISSLQVQKDNEMLNDEILEDTLSKMMNYVDFLNTTIEDFRSFFKLETKKEYTTVEEVYNKASIIIDTLAERYLLKIEKDFKYDGEILVNISEMTQVFLIIVKNSIDAMYESDIKNMLLKVRSFKEHDMCVIEFEDIGGGISDEILPKIFKKRFTTKGESHGTGIGLDMSKTIIEVKMNGKITARNGKDGAIISIYLPIILV